MMWFHGIAFVLVVRDIGRRHRYATARSKSRHYEFDRDSVIDTLTASREGVHLIQRTSDGWSKTKLGTGMIADDPNQSGAGQVIRGLS